MTMRIERRQNEMTEARLTASWWGWKNMLAEWLITRTAEMDAWETCGQNTLPIFTFFQVPVWCNRSLQCTAVNTAQNKTFKDIRLDASQNRWDSDGCPSSWVKGLIAPVPGQGMQISQDAMNDPRVSDIPLKGLKKETYNSTHPKDTDCMIDKWHDTYWNCSTLCTSALRSNWDFPLMGPKRLLLGHLCLPSCLKNPSWQCQSQQPVLIPSVSHSPPFTSRTSEKNRWILNRSQMTSK